MSDERQGRNMTAPDGYEYAVMFNDGNVSRPFTGRTQRQRTLEQADALAAEFAPDLITAARRLPGRPWERV